MKNRSHNETNLLGQKHQSKEVYTSLCCLLIDGSSGVGWKHIHAGEDETKNLTARKVGPSGMGLGQRALHSLLEVFAGSLVLGIHGVYGAGSHGLGFPEGRKEGVLGRLRREGPDGSSRGTFLLRTWRKGLVRLAN